MGRAMTDGLTKHSRFVVELTAGYVPNFYIHEIVYIFKWHYDFALEIERLFL